LFKILGSSLQWVALVCGQRSEDQKVSFFSHFFTFQPSHHHASKARCGPPFSEKVFTGRVFGDMFFKLGAPERQKRSAASVQRIHFCKPRMLAAQIAPFYVVGCYACVIVHT
jgi:hypothetical protein